MLFSIANAAEATTAPSSSIVSFMPIVIIFAVFYFLIIRPQSKRAKEEQNMRNHLQIGNKIVTTSGIFGTISEIDKTKDVISVSLAKDVTIVMYKSSIASVLKDKDDNTKQEKIEKVGVTKINNEKL